MLIINYYVRSQEQLNAAEQKYDDVNKTLKLTEDDLEKAEDRADVADNKAKALEQELASATSELKKLTLQQNKASNAQAEGAVVIVLQLRGAMPSYNRVLGFAPAPCLLQEIPRCLSSRRELRKYRIARSANCSTRMILRVLILMDNAMLCYVYSWRAKWRR